MAAGDVYNTAVTTVALNGYLSFQPGVGAEIIVHNISHSDSAILEYYDGSTAITVDTQSGAGAWCQEFFHCSNARYYRIKVTAAGGANCAADGIYSK
jgi:hypothetical protein